MARMLDEQAIEQHVVEPLGTCQRFGDTLT